MKLKKEGDSQKKMLMNKQKKTNIHNTRKWRTERKSLQTKLGTINTMINNVGL